MSVYKLNGNAWGGSFILEASTNGTDWDTMVAKNSNGTFLGREGLETPSGTIVSSGYNSLAFSNTVFSIYKAISSYNWPTNLSNLNIIGNSGALSYNLDVDCSINVNGGDRTFNKLLDFDVHLVYFSTPSPYYFDGTTFNCKVTDYTSSSGLLKFTVNANIVGECMFIVIIRSSEGTGVRNSIPLISSKIIVDQITLPTPVVCFKTTNVSYLEGGVWSQAGATLQSSVTIGGGFSIHDNIFGSKKAIFTQQSSGSFRTSHSIVLGGNNDISLTYTIYLLARPYNGSGYSPYMSGYSDNYIQYFGRNPGLGSPASILNNSNPNSSNSNSMYKANPVWVPYNGVSDTFPTSGFEIWCFCKKSGYPGSETYRNNTTQYVSPEIQRGTVSTAPYSKSSFWNLGAGSFNWINGSSYIGAFIVYNTYHDSMYRGAVQKMLETEFGVLAS